MTGRPRNGCGARPGREPGCCIPARAISLADNPFAGSGSSRTALRDPQLDLIWRGCDIDPAYADDFRSQPGSGE